ncbi:hypothetical protein MCB86_08820 [Pseudomonas sp. KSR10]|uniref:hypothetical protein n=1 Tax=Pseudomonas sp. KSR10 TaxID=2916654 RepID=UPI001EF773E1|nr:hypothetical protein [Pseudomonas sp. KSR10]MCG6540177.1 hypothetical protein [Pseudomonas sp. KSR10]
MSELKIAYEPHPVTPERKAELRKQGFKIIDARFKPQDADGEPEAGGTGRKPSHGLRVDDIKAKLTEKGITFDEGAERAELAKLLDEAP